MKKTIEIIKKSDVKSFFDKNGLDKFSINDIAVHSLYNDEYWVNGATVKTYLDDNVLFGNLIDTVSEVVVLEETIVKGTYSTYNVVARNYFYWIGS
jgi:hypothetical protein